MNVSNHPFIRPGQVAPDRPARDACMQCGQPEAVHNMREFGPFETEHQAARLPAVRATYDAAHASTRRGVIAERNHRMLCEAITAAGVDLGAFDHRIVQWLAGWEPQTVAVIAGIILRALAAAWLDGVSAGAATGAPLSLADLPDLISALDDAGHYRAEHAAGECTDCGDESLCEVHERDVILSARYAALARLLGDAR